MVTMHNCNDIIEIDTCQISAPLNIDFHICLHKSLCLPENWSKLAKKVILDENQLKLVSRS